MYDSFFIGDFVNLCSFQKYSLMKKFGHIATNIATPSAECKSAVNVDQFIILKVENREPKLCKLRE